MSYGFELGPQALEMMKDLPDEALTALAVRTGELIRDPWDAWPLYPGRTDYRETTYGDGRGLMHFYVDEQAEFLSIFMVLWTG
ncbi:hypothetical protein ACIBH1_44570 [Nonomuraea sp. NPDC050663]|uniref:hypothetical protein n=1 Tax=Nonomuraea sp. NPDC050663 TaxID=3364370 RepID=UPI0037BC85E7